MKKDKWKQYSKYLSDFHYKTDRVLRDQYLEFHQFPEERADIREGIDLDMFRKRLMDVINETLTAKESQVIAYRFGLIDGNMLTMDQISKILDICAGRVYQIEMKAMRKLRSPLRIKKLLCPQEFKIWDKKREQVRIEIEREHEIRLKDIEEKHKHYISQNNIPAHQIIDPHLKQWRAYQMKFSKDALENSGLRV